MKSFGIIALLSTAAVLAGCSQFSTGSSGSADSVETSTVFETADLSVMELRHRVKRVTKTTFWRATLGPDSESVDTAAAHRTVTVAYFDSLGNYVSRRDERIQRDNLGRIVRWEDRRPNLNRQHGGFLKDTLGYEHISNNVVCSEGMGDFAVTVYDDNHRIVGQYTDPVIDGEQTAVFNVYRKSDEHDNWTERLSVWTTQQPGSRPHISYTLERREIVYY